MAQADPDTGWRGRLAEMERALEALAADLAQDLGEPAARSPGDAAAGSPGDAAAGSLGDAAAGSPAAAPVGPAPAAPGPSAALAAMCARLLASMRELMSGYELALTHVSAWPASEAGPGLTVAAGPFDSTAVLARFQATLLALPDVAQVTVRGYEGSDRALLEVHLQGRVA
jgi:hypothetical protein